MKWLKKRDFIFISILIIVVFIIFLLFKFVFYNETGNLAYITLNNKYYGTYSLSENKEILINNKENSNKIIIKDGYVYMAKASCPDKICVKMGKINKTGQTICCLPNKVLITIKGDSEEFDSVVK